MDNATTEDEKHDEFSRYIRFFEARVDSTYSPFTWPILADAEDDNPFISMRTCIARNKFWATSTLPQVTADMYKQLQISPTQQLNCKTPDMTLMTPTTDILTVFCGGQGCSSLPKLC